MINKEKLFRSKRKIALLSVVINALLVAIKAVGGFITGSQVLLADAVHSLSDLAAAFSVFIGITISNRKSKQFPFGLYKVENLVALISAFAIFFAGYEIVRDTLLEPSQPITELRVALVVIFLTLIITYSFSRYERKVGERLNSPSLIADAEHVKTDMLSTLIVLVGVLAQYFEVIWLEKLAVVIVVLLIFHAGFEVLKEAVKVLLDASVDYETIEKVKKILEEQDLVVKVNSITGRNSGSFVFLELDLVLATNSLEEAHNFAEYLEKLIKEKVPFVERVLVHFEQGHKVIKIAVLADEQGKICKHIGNCPKIYIFTKVNGQFEKQVFANPAVKLEKRKALEVVEFLKEQQVACLVVNEPIHSEPAKYALKDAFIKVIEGDYQTLDDIDFSSLECS